MLDKSTLDLCVLLVLASKLSHDRKSRLSIITSDQSVGTSQELLKLSIVLSLKSSSYKSILADFDTGLDRLVINFALSEFDSQRVEVGNIDSVIG